MSDASSRRIIIDPPAAIVLLFLAAFFALLMANTDANSLYHDIIHFPIQLANLKPSNLTLLMIVNDGLMAVFFLTIGLDIKFELLHGELNSRVQAICPIIAAFGGMVAPSVIYILMTTGTSSLHVGWAIPAATDISFAIGVLSLLGKRVPVGLRIFLLALAIIDDLGAILIIALFYNTALDPLALSMAGAVIVIMAMLNRANVPLLSPYLLLGVLLWSCILFSGIHATLAGIIVGWLIPLKLPDTDASPAGALENRLQPLVMYFILPLFAFSNSGISLQNVVSERLTSLLPLAIAAGLVVGKPLGVILFVAAALKLKIAKLPDGIVFRQIAAAAVLCGIGFTMSIFIANLAFLHDEPETIVLAKIGILSGSVIAALLGYLLLRAILPRLPVSEVKALV